MLLSVGASSLLYFMIRNCLYVVQGLEATDDIITHQPLIEYIGSVMLRDQYDNGETSFERYVLPNVVCSTA